MPMERLVYHIVPHDTGWAYRVGATYSETFGSHDAARTAAKTAAREQLVAGRDASISWEDSQGNWHDELARGDDRPETGIEG